ncbi:MAG: hypothetical protein IT233_14160 [Bacteroidia bacterium]|nr:hypothetical protein [Bacteroidia bacterium]
MPYSDYLYNSAGLLTDEIYYHVVTGKVAMHYKYESDKSGLFKRVSYTSPYEPSWISDYDYEYYK